MTFKKISTQAILSLKDALTHIYWRKTDLRKFIELSINNTAIVSTIDWQTNPKFESVSQLIDRMMLRQDIYNEDILILLKETSNFEDFSHLKYWDEKGDLTKKAKEAVEKLRNQTKGHFEIVEELNKSNERRLNNQEKLKQTVSFTDKLEQLKQDF